MNFWNKTKNTTAGGKKRRDNWNQSLKTNLGKRKRIRRSLQYLLLLKKFDNVVDYNDTYNKEIIWEWSGQPLPPILAFPIRKSV